MGGGGGYITRTNLYSLKIWRVLSKIWVNWRHRYRLFCDVEVPCTHWYPRLLPGRPGPSISMKKFSGTYKNSNTRISEKNTECLFESLIVNGNFSLTSTIHHLLPGLPHSLLPGLPTSSLASFKYCTHSFWKDEIWSWRPTLNDWFSSHFSMPAPPQSHHAGCCYCLTVPLNLLCTPGWLVPPVSA